MAAEMRRIFFLAFKDVFWKFSSRWLPLTGSGQIQRKTKQKQKNSFYHIPWLKTLVVLKADCKLWL